MWQAAVERPGAAVVGASRLRQTVEAKGGWSTARYAPRKPTRIRMDEQCARRVVRLDHDIVGDGHGIGIANGAGPQNIAVIGEAHPRPKYAGGGCHFEPDSSADQRLYDKPVSASQIVVDNAAQPTPAGQSLIAVLDGRDWH